VEIMSLDSTSIKVHPNGTGALKNKESRPLETPEADATPRFICLPHPPGRGDIFPGAVAIFRFATAPLCPGIRKPQSKTEI